MTRPPGLRPQTKTKHEATRQSNRRLLLQSIFDRGPISRADLARTTELGRATVSEIAADLISEGLVVDVGQGVSTGGKPPTLIELDPDGRFVVAVDLSTRPISAALLNLRGRIVASVQGITLAPRGRDVLEEVHRLVAELIGTAKMPALGIGLGVPGAVDADGRVLESEKLGWSQLPLRDQLEDVYGLPTYAAADAEVAAIAEFAKSETAPSSMLYVKVDDRVSVAVVADGRLHRTPRRGGDLSHLSVAGSSVPCRCGRIGCLGSQVSVEHILGPDALDISSEAIRRLSAETTPGGEEAAQILGSALAPVVASLDIDHVVIGGLFAEWESIAVSVAAGIESSVGWSPVVATSRLGESAVILGAAGQVLSGELGVVWG